MSKPKLYTVGSYTDQISGIQVVRTQHVDVEALKKCKTCKKNKRDYPSQYCKPCRIPHRRAKAAEHQFQEKVKQQLATKQ